MNKKNYILLYYCNSPMNFLCMPCDYTTSHKCDIEKHYKTHKHKVNFIAYKKNKKIQEKKQFQCIYCPALFTSQSGMFKHQNKCKNDELTLLKQQLKQVEIEAEIKFLKQEIKSKDEIIEIFKTQSTTTNTIATKSVSALTYLVRKHKNAPPLLQIEHDEAKKLLKCDEDESLTGNILIEYREDRLDEFIGNIIVGFYKKEDPNQQSIWNSDASRLTFLIKDIIGNKSEWMTDKKGTKLRQLVIKPITTLIEELIRNWQIEQAKVNDYELDVEQTDVRMVNTTNAIGILADVKSGALEEKISRHLSPRFGLNRI